MTAPTTESIAEQLGAVRRELAEIGRDDARIVAVTKGFDAEVITAARAAGIEDFGESYAQELESKREALAGARVHFIGRIQRNKVRRIADVVDLWHSVSRRRVLREIADRRPGSSVLLQVRVGGDDTKDGFDPSELTSVLTEAGALDLDIRGLMTIGVLDDRDATRVAFEDLRRLTDTHGLAECSMGMSADYLDAAAAGATMLRLGSVLFGPRPR